MFKILIFMLTGVVLNATNHYFVADLSRGMTKKEFQELGRLSNVTPESNLYADGDKVKLMYFKSNKTYKTSFVYYKKGTKEKGYKIARNKHHHFFKKVMKNLKKPKKRIVRANIVFLVDTSGSMITKKGDLLSKVKRSMKQFVQNKSRGAEVSIITFDGKTKQKEYQRSKVIIQNETDKKALNRIIDSIQVSKYDTFLGSGLKKVSQVIPLSSKFKNIVMIFTDGAKINDYDVAKNELEKLKSENIDVKVVAVGGADVEMLKAFSTSNYVYNATSTDLQSIIKEVSTSSDEIIVRLSNFFEHEKLTKDDNVVIYSTFLNIDSISDFSLIPNLSSQDFYNELKIQNKKRGVNLNFEQASVYNRVIGEKTAEDVNKLKGFWNPFMKDANVNLKYFDSSSLSQGDL